MAAQVEEYSEDVLFAKALEDIKNKPSVPFETITPGGSVCYFLKNPGTDAYKSISLWKCRACSNRTKIFQHLYGPNGPVFGENIDPKNMDVCLFNLRDAIKKTPLNEQEATLLLVDENTFPGFYDQTARPPADGTVYYHLTVVPSQVSESSVANKFNPLWNKYKSILDSRLSKFIEFQGNLEAVKMTAEQSDHPDHWLPTINWVFGIVNYSKGTSIESMNVVQKMNLRVFALMTGSSNGTTHFDYHKSENIIDFLQMDDPGGILATMNERRDERNYMISDIDKAMKANGVTDPYTISLVWGKCDDTGKVVDLDIWVRNPKGQWVSFNNKNNGGMKLNFDAGVGDNNSDNPVENVSIMTMMKGNYLIYVNNYNMKGTHEDIPFQVVVKMTGNPDIIYDGVWEARRGEYTGRNASNMIKVAEVDFSSAPKPSPVMVSDKKAQSFAAKDPDFMAQIGNEPTSMVCTSDECEGYLEMPHVPTVTATVISNGPTKPSIYGGRARRNPPPLNVTAVEAFNQMTLNSQTTAPGSFPQMAIPTRFDRLDDLFKFVFDNQGEVSLSVQINQVSPGFLVNVKTSGNVVYNPVPVHYRDIGQLPMEPTYRGPARGGENGEWFPEKGFLEKVKVTGLWRKNPPTGAPIFFVTLEDAHLPQDSPTFPLMGASGMYPTVLKSSAHQHRSKFSSVGTLVTPTMPTTSGTPMIGGFLFGDNEEFFLNDLRVCVGGRENFEGAAAAEEVSLVM